MYFQEYFSVANQSLGNKLYRDESRFLILVPKQGNSAYQTGFLLQIDGKSSLIYAISDSKSFEVAERVGLIVLGGESKDFAVLNQQLSNVSPFLKVSWQPGDRMMGVFIEPNGKTDIEALKSSILQFQGMKIFPEKSYSMADQVPIVGIATKIPDGTQSITDLVKYRTPGLIPSGLLPIKMSTTVSPDCRDLLKKLPHF